ncbi:unnamed protein product, partial [Rotaria magnacalcarata]
MQRFRLSSNVIQFTSSSEAA